MKPLPNSNSGAHIVCAPSRSSMATDPLAEEAMGHGSGSYQARLCSDVAVMQGELKVLKQVAILEDVPIRGISSSS